jgi:hypothetical protein
MSTAFAQSVTVDVTLNPMGDFKIKTDAIIGNATLIGQEINAENIVVKMANLKSGIDLRDKHMQKNLNSVLFPEAILIVASGKGGVGKGKIKIRGIEKEIEGTYKIDGKTLNAEFKLNLSDFEIKEISYMGLGVEDTVMIDVSLPIK